MKTVQTWHLSSDSDAKDAAVNPPTKSHHQVEVGISQLTDIVLDITGLDHQAATATSP
jgi:dihydroorotase-like cyclic amidohydrolase